MKKQDMIRRRDHEQIRNRVGIFDFTMGVLEITGRDARGFTDMMCVNRISKLKPGRVIYTSLLNDEAHMIDDVTVYCFHNEKFWLISPVLDATLQWLEDHRGRKSVHFENLSDKINFWSIQGPDSRRLLASYLKEDMTSLGYYSFMENEVGGIPIILSRTGFTGELGYEIFADNSRILQIVEDLLEAGKRLGVKVIESDVTLESVPTEKGLITARDFTGCNPLEMDMEWTVDWDKKKCIGMDALKKVKENGPSRKLMGFIADTAEVDIENKSVVKADGQEIGVVTTANYGYTVEKSIGYCLIDSTYAIFGKEIFIVTGEQEVRAQVCERVFYDKERTRINAKALSAKPEMKDTKAYLRQQRANERSVFKGVFAAMPTPMGTDESLDIHGIIKLTNYLAESGLDGILVGGSSGEYPVMSMEERKRLIRTAVEAAAGKCKIAACCSMNSTYATKELCAYAGEVGVDFILLMTPFDPPAQECEMIAYYKEIARASTPGIVIYQYPDYTGASLSTEAVIELSRERNIVGIKNVADLTSTVAIINGTKDEEFGVLTGTDEVFLGALACGSDGFMGVGASIAPKLCVELYNNFREGKISEAQDCHRKLCKIMDVVFTGAFPATLKTALELQGYSCGLPRKPASAVDMETRRKLQNVLAGTGVL